MLGVAAMAVQNALVQISLKDSPTTAVMTTNVTHFVLDLGELIVGRDRGRSRQGAAPRHAYPAGDHRLYDRLRARRGMRSCRRAVVSGSAYWSRPARSSIGPPPGLTVRFASAAAAISRQTFCVERTYCGFSVSVLTSLSSSPTHIPV